MCIINLRRYVKNLEYSFAPCKGGLNGVVHIRKLAKGLDKVLSIDDEGGNNTDRYQPFQGNPPSNGCNDNDKEVSKNVGQRHEHHGVAVGIDCRLKNFLVLTLKPLNHFGVSPECLDHFEPADGLFHDAVHLSKLFLQLPETFAGVAGNKLREPEHDRNNKQCSQGKPYIEQKHGDHDSDQREDACHQRGDILRDRLIDGINIIGQPAHQATG